MGRAPCCEKTGLKRGPWTPEEDAILINYIQKKGHGSWRALPKLAGLLRCGKSCRLRWTNYLRSDIKRGSFTQEEERTIIQLHAILGNRWSAIASQLPGRTDNEIKNFWNTHLKKRLLKMGLDPSTHAPKSEVSPSAPQEYEAMALTRHKAQWENARLEAEARLSRESLIMSSGYSAGYHTSNTVDMMAVPSNNPPTDFFLKIWNSEAGKDFRKESSSRIISKSCDNSYHVFDENHPNGGGYNHVLTSEIPKTPRSSASVSSSSYASTLNSCDESLNPNDKDKENAHQQCNSASVDWIGNCIMKTPEILPCFADVIVCQTGYKAPDDSSSSEKLGPPHVHYTGYSELPLDNDNNNNIGSMITELTEGFQQQSAWPWPELHLEDDSDCWSNVSFMASAHS